jgi:hypothetical protein
MAQGFPRGFNHLTLRGHIPASAHRVPRNPSCSPETVAGDREGCASRNRSPAEKALVFSYSQFDKPGTRTT